MRVSLRFYVHHEEEPEFTLAVSWSVADRRTVRDLSAQFAAAFARAFPTHVPTSFTLSGEELGELPRASCVCSCVRDGADLIAAFAPVDAPAAPAATAVAARASSSKPGVLAGSAGTAQLDASLKPYLEAADKAWKARAYARAKTIYTELLGVVPTLGVALSRLGEIEAQAGRHDGAVPLFERALRAEPSSVARAVALAKAHLAAGDGAEAVSVLRDAAGALEGQRGAAAAAKARLLRIELGRTLFAAGARQEGGQVLTQILSEDMEKPDALQAYGEACVALGQHDDALKIFLRLVTTRSEDKRVRRMLATSLGEPAAG